MSGRVKLVWSSAVPEPPANASLHGTPVGDFLSHFKVGDVSIAASHPALDADEWSLPNAFCHFPLLEELHYIEAFDDLPDNLVTIAALDPAQQSSAPAPAKSIPELLDAKLTPGAHPCLGPQELESLRELCMEFSDIFSDGSQLGRVPDEFNVQFTVVSDQGVHVDEDKVSSILNLPRPQTVKDIRSFVGMAGYFRHFIKDFAKLSAPLEYLTRKGVKFEWSVECQTAFEGLKEALTSAPCLHQPDWSRQFVLHIDWSKKAIGAVLSQFDDDGHEYPIAFASRLLTPAEQNYCPLEGDNNEQNY
jgi:hypothetical protein